VSCFWRIAKATLGYLFWFSTNDGCASTFTEIDKNNRIATAAKNFMVQKYTFKMLRCIIRKLNNWRLTINGLLKNFLGLLICPKNGP